MNLEPQQALCTPYASASRLLAHCTSNVRADGPRPTGSWQPASARAAGALSSLGVRGQRHIHRTDI